MNASIEATGLPGSPKKCADWIRPNASGRPGCIATCQKSIAPISPSTSLTRSSAPTETPPERDHDVTDPGGLEQPCAQLVPDVGDDAEVDDVAAALLDRRRAG